MQSSETRAREKQKSSTPLSSSLALLRGFRKILVSFFSLSLFLKYIHLPRTLTTLAIRDPLQPSPLPGSTLVIGKISHLLQAAWETTVGMNALGNSSIN